MLIFAMLLFAAAGLAQEPLDIGKVAAGQAASGFLEVPAGVDEGTRIPVTVVRGATPGPVLAVLAGVHGYEYSPVLAVQKLRGQIDPKRLAGTVILVHVANMPS